MLYFVMRAKMPIPHPFNKGVEVRRTKGAFLYKDRATKQELKKVRIELHSKIEKDKTELCANALYRFRIIRVR